MTANRMVHLHWTHMEETKNVKLDQHHAPTFDRPGHFILVGPLPPPVNGHTLAFQLLVREWTRRQLPAQVIDYSRTFFDCSSSLARPVIRVIDYFFLFPSFLAAIRNAPGGTLYLTLNQAPSGVIRDILFIELARRYKYRVIAHLHGGCYDQVLASLPRWVRTRAIRALSHCEPIILLSNRLRTMLRTFPTLTERAVVVPNGLPFDPPPDRGPKTLSQGQPVKFLYLSHFTESKGWWEVLETIEILARSRPWSLHLTMCGKFFRTPGEERRFASLEEARQAFQDFRQRLSQQFGDRVQVTWHPMVQGQTKEQVLREAHFLLLPTRYPNEGQPLVLIEGLAFGCVLLGPDYRALGDMIRPGESGCLVPPDPAAMAASLISLIDRPEEYHRLSRGALSLFHREFSARRHLDAMVQILVGEDRTSDRTFP
ncbi:MAG: Glycosyl transferase, group 1 [Candidatus Ozemobacter sibiricus]|uniref:Glycosyl transferase, group 1 n=1 Tax=Candidatus Ozemobacter sibiricus TaxID=2268124 RepID=A0A367ZPI1_9BACT|nr:MAG: Glycosyl transferase, group 1 [Candidatus Ozemobacter sibiricus]